MLHGLQVFAIVKPSATGELVVALPDAQTHLLPGDLIHLTQPLFGQIVVQSLIVTDAVDGIGKGMDIPVVYLDTVVECAVSLHSHSAC